MRKPSDQSEEASKLLRRKAGVIDSALSAAGTAPLLAISMRSLRRGQANSDASGESLKAARMATFVRVAGPLATLLAQQYGSPGQRLLGLRPVDRRTGERMELWRALLAAALSVAPGLLGERLLRRPERQVSGPSDSEMRAEIAAIRAEHAGDQAGLQRAIGAYHERHRVHVSFDPLTDIGLPLLLVVGVGRLARMLTRRIAPSVVISIRDPYSP
jgi:hypothetical protein